MDTTKLRQWLGLPPGAWPPADRELLGLPPGPATAADVETNALERMDRLRMHQLVNPDLVTEGMNRLAQAMIALTDAALAAAPPEPPKPKKARKPKSEPLLDLRLNKAEVPDPVVVPPEPEILDAEVLDAEMVERPPPKPALAKRFVPPDALPPEPLALDEVPPPALAGPPPPGAVFAPGERRAGYRHLVRLRLMMRELDKLRPFVADPGEQLLSPVKVFGFVDAVRSFRTVAARGLPTVAGAHVVAVAGHPLALPVFRSLVASQRSALAVDWARAAAELRAEYEQARAAMTATKPRRRLAAELRAARDWFRDNPEWLPAALVVLAFLVALARTAVRAKATAAAINLLDINPGHF